MPPPNWALAERALLAAYGDAAGEFAARYLDQRGFLRCVERWGGNDGPDDAMENFHNWPLVYALGGPEALLELYRTAWEGHLVQYTQARAPNVEMARHGMYHKEFVTSFDWEHTGEGLAAFHFYALAAPGDPTYRQRVRRFAGFYLNEDPGAPNYDPQHKIIRSLHNGSRGPKLTGATPEDWGGEPIPGQPDRLTRYKTAGNIRGDHPLNLAAATLALNACALTGERKYRDWLLEYVGAWRDRVLANGGNIPTNIGLDGRIGGEWNGKWYGGTFGWNFWPETSGRNYYMRGARIAFGEAFLLTADPGFIEPLKRQIANLYAAQKVERGRTLPPNKHGDKGWYGYTPDQHLDVQRDIYLWTMQPADLEHISADPWIAYLAGKNPNYPETALRGEFERVRRQVQALRADPSTPDTRAADDPQRFNPVSAGALVNLTVGGNDPDKAGNILHSRVRYFDPARRRAGLALDVAALVEKILPEETVLTLVNTNPVHARQIVVRMGAYGEHHCASAAFGGNTVKVDGRDVSVELAPGAGETLRIAVKRYVHPPTLELPW
ncbi:MAG: hypothetical protein HY822_09785 [Acidobacteria bacterium]|nr:hypothetical protein [Acidobacteriota bacterium]